MAIFSRLLKDFLVGGVHLYRWLISPLLGKCCRFYPSCSQYALDAFEKHGVGKGSFLTIKRLCKCHPFHQGGIDHVP